MLFVKNSVLMFNFFCFDAWILISNEESNENNVWFGYDIQNTCGFHLGFHLVSKLMHVTNLAIFYWLSNVWIINEFENEEGKSMRFLAIIIRRDPFSLTQIADHQRGQMCGNEGKFSVQFELHEADSSGFRFMHFLILNVELKFQQIYTLLLPFLKFTHKPTSSLFLHFSITFYVDKPKFFNFTCEE